MGDIDNFICKFLNQEYHNYCFYYMFTENQLQTCRTILKYVCENKKTFKVKIVTTLDNYCFS